MQYEGVHTIVCRYLSHAKLSAGAMSLALALCLSALAPLSLEAQGCTSNPIVCENALPGNTGWDVSGAGDPTIQGFATDMSVNAGSTISFKISTPATNYHIDIYRIGYYAGNGARKITTITPSASLPQTQPACLTDVSSLMTDCGNWGVSASWTVPSTAVSGIYLAVPIRADTGGASHIVFVVRNDSSHSDILFQTSDETWQAYNSYGGHSLYGAANTFDLPNRSYKVSYNRPVITRTFDSESATWVFGAEYPMARWLEANGYDVSYTSSVDAARNGALITNHKMYLSIGHDEYWSGPKRASVQAARDAGVSLAFFSGNEVFWKTRWENSIDGSNTAYRTLVCYKETLDGTSSGGIKDPDDPPTWTGTWRDPRFSPPADGGFPENALTGTLFMVNGPGTDNPGNLRITVPSADGKMRFWRNTAVASLAAGASYQLPVGTLGYEWDSDIDNGSRPAGAFQLSTSTYTLTTDLLLDYGATYGAGTTTHHAIMYRAPSGALVFGAGTVQWTWALDSNHDNPFFSPNTAADPNVQQATVNLFADMGVQPATIQSGLTPATQSTDLTPPTSTITSPTSGSSVQYGNQVTITGTATDAGGGVVGGVEVSTDGGHTWHPATGRGTWTYTWTAFSVGNVTIKSRAVDDSGNLETPGAGVTITIPQPPVFPDVTVSTDAPTAGLTVTSPSFSTTSGNELLLAFISGDYLSGANTTVTGIAGAGLTWTLVVRTNGQSGTAEIWRAFSSAPLSNVSVTATLSQSVVSSISVMTFVGADPSGTNGSGAIGATASKNAKTGAPTASLVTTRNNSWVFGVGTDYDAPIARTPGTGQSLVHQYLTPPGDTYWVQMMNVPTPTSGTTVTLNDTSPTGDRFDLSIVEVLPAPSGPQTWSVSGSITPAASGSGATLNLTGAATASTTANVSGNYSFSGLANGIYTVTPGKSGFTFTPPSQQVTINGANQTTVNFTAQAVPTFSISGTITGGSGATVALSGAASGSTTADTNGNYTFPGLANGSYTVTPSKTGFTFMPPNQAVTINNANQIGVNFTAQALPTYSISGTISPTSGGSGATVTLSGGSSASTTADANGNYSFSGLVNGSYTVTPSLTGFVFTPPNQAVTVSGASVSAIDFTASPAITIDANVSKDGTGGSTTIASPTFSTKSGNELLLAFVTADYLGGTNTSVTAVSGGGLTWTLAVRSNAQSGTSEIWRAFATTPVTGATVTATLSQSVISSITVLTFAGVDPSGPVGATASKSAAKGAPTVTVVTTRNNSWVFGVGNDFDNAIARTPAAGQTLVHQDLTSTGDTYWVQKQNSPTPLSGTSVSINDTAPTTDRFNMGAVEVLPAPVAAPQMMSRNIRPASSGAKVIMSNSGNGVVDITAPAVSMTSPAPNQTISSLSTVAAVASDDTSVAGVQFLLDGAALGAEITTPPYSMTWNTTSVSGGSHTLAARARDSVGLTTTSMSVVINVDNSGDPVVVGSWSSPVTLPAVAANLILLPSSKVLFYRDGSTPTVWDYSANTFRTIPASVDLSCSAHAVLSDGRILAAGGDGGGGDTTGAGSAEIFSPTAQTWTPAPNMAYKGGCPNATALPDGRVLVTAGPQRTSHSNAGIAEIYDPTTNTWTQLPTANHRLETYPFMYVLPDGRVVHIGGSEYPTDTDVLDLTTGTWSVIDPNIVDGGSATMYSPGKFMKAGSATDNQGVGPSSNSTFVLDTTQPFPAWQQMPPMAYSRSFLNLTMLPDGTALATGGETDKNGGNISNAVYAAELWSPLMQTWTTMSSMHTPREYQATALLLPDGRVLVSGMGADSGNVSDQLSAEFFSPPYLFKGTRPTITRAPAQIGYGSNISVSTPDAASIASVALIRTGAVTHSFDQNERFVPLTFTQTSGGLTVTTPANANIAPPGYYMLFIVNSAGVPSIAPFVQLQ